MEKVGALLDESASGLQGVNLGMQQMQMQQVLQQLQLQQHQPMQQVQMHPQQLQPPPRQPPRSNPFSLDAQRLLRQQQQCS
jgi:hypothetical protein